MHPTRNDIPLAARKKLVGLLNQLLADSVDLYSQAKQAHWNVREMPFIALHELFDKVSDAVNDGVDMIAERIQQLGGVAEGTVRMAAKNTRLKEYPLKAVTAVDHVTALANAIASFNKESRKAIDTTDEWGDKVTSDMLTGITRELDKQLWFVEAHLKHS